jgi:hypothetical protein
VPAVSLSTRKFGSRMSRLSQTLVSTRQLSTLIPVMLAGAE